VKFKLWLHEAKQFDQMHPDDITHWAKYASKMNFKTPEEAKAWLLRKRELADSYPGPFAPDGTEYNQAFSNAMPTWQSGKSFKIGKRIQNDNRLRLSHLEVKKPDLEELNNVAQANGTSNYTFHPVQWISVSNLHNEDDYYLSNSAEKARIQNLAQEIKNNGWIEAVIYNWKGKWIIEGQHRARAMKFLGFKTVPGVGIEYEDE